MIVLTVLEIVEIYMKSNVIVHVFSKCESGAGSTCNRVHTASADTTGSHINNKCEC